MIVVAGSLNMDLVGRVPLIPRGGETVLGTTLSRLHGGKGGNQAVAAARLGARVAFAGALGDDTFGDELLRGLQHEAIDTAQVVRAAGASGCALISVADSGENAISVLPGANLQAPGPPSRWPLEWTLLLLQLEIPLAQVLAWATAAHAAAARVLLNAAPMQALPPQLLAATDVLIVNQRELAALAESSQRLPRRRVATLGQQGLQAWDGDRVINLPGHAVPVIDTTGAGDTFCGALATMFDAGAAFDLALQHANAAAALACTRFGARAGMPTRCELDTWLAARR